MLTGFKYSLFSKGLVFFENFFLALFINRERGWCDIVVLSGTVVGGRTLTVGMGVNLGVRAWVVVEPDLVVEA